jgi:hypothetical protein
LFNKPQIIEVQSKHCLVAAAATAAVAATAVATTAAAAAVTTTAATATAATAAVTTAAACATTVATATSAWRTSLHWASFVHYAATTTQRLTIHASNSCLCFGIAAHFHKAKTF